MLNIKLSSMLRNTLKYLYGRRAFFVIWILLFFAQFSILNYSSQLFAYDSISSINNEVAKRLHNSEQGFASTKISIDQSFLSNDVGFDDIYLYEFIVNNAIVQKGVKYSAKATKHYPETNNSLDFYNFAPDILTIETINTQEISNFNYFEFISITKQNFYLYNYIYKGKNVCVVTKTIADYWIMQGVSNSYDELLTKTIELNNKGLSVPTNLIIVGVIDDTDDSYSFFSDSFGNGCIFTSINTDLSELMYDYYFFTYGSNLAQYNLIRDINLQIENENLINTVTRFSQTSTFEYNIVSELIALSHQTIWDRVFFILISGITYLGLWLFISSRVFFRDYINGDYFYEKPKMIPFLTLTLASLTFAINFAIFDGVYLTQYTRSSLNNTLFIIVSVVYVSMNIIAFAISNTSIALKIRRTIYEK